MESTQRKQRRQRTKYTEFQAKTTLEVMENKSTKGKPSTFAVRLSSLEERVRCQLMDRMAMLRPTRTAGRVNIEIREDSLTAILDQLQEKETSDMWSGEREQMQGKICSLKAQLDKAQANVSSWKEIEDLKSQLKTTSETLWKTQTSLQQQTSSSKDLQLQLEKAYAEKEDLQKEVEAMRSEVRVEKQLQAVADGNTETFEARRKAEELEQDLVFEKNQVYRLQDKLSKINNALVRQKEDAEKILERTQASHRAELEERNAETRKISSALKNAEDLLETERLRWQQERTSLLEETEKSRALHVAQLGKRDQENNTLLAALKNTQQQLESHRIEWQEDKSSLLQATDGHKKTLQEKEQEWEEKESSMKSKLEDLESQVNKKKKKKWYRKLF